MSNEYINAKHDGIDAAHKFMTTCKLDPGPDMTASHDTYYGWHDGFNERIIAGFSHNMIHDFMVRLIRTTKGG